MRWRRQKSPLRAIHKGAYKYSYVEEERNRNSIVSIRSEAKQRRSKETVDGGWLVYAPPAVMFVFIQKKGFFSISINTVHIRGYCKVSRPI